MFFKIPLDFMPRKQDLSNLCIHMFHQGRKTVCVTGSPDSTIN